MEIQNHLLKGDNVTHKPVGTEKYGCDNLRICTNNNNFGYYPLIY